MPIIEQPHPDLELGVPRNGLAYEIRLPSGGMTESTGVLFYIHGWGARYHDAYAQKLLPYLADHYDCLVLSVDYHGAAAYSGNSRHPAPDFFEKLAEHHGVTVAAPAGIDTMYAVKLIAAALAKQGVSELHQECRLLSDQEGYVNFGVLPALDHLQVLAQVLRQYPIDKRRIFLLGTSYGGYVAMLMAKIAPNSFRMVIDNSGFSGPDDSAATRMAVYGAGQTVSPLRVVVQCPFAFHADPNHPNFFAPRHRQIRQLDLASHYSIKSETHFYCYHSATDKVAPTETKSCLARTLSKFRRYDLKIIRMRDIDGRIFKDTGHGMSASMRGMFEMTYRRWLDEAKDSACHTDFDLMTINRLRCGDSDYIFSFNETTGVSLSLAPV